jgi:hypothetical protein
MLVGLCACSVPDGGDMDDLRARIQAMPPDVVQKLQEWALRERVRQYLERLGTSRQIGKIECKGFGLSDDWWTAFYVLAEDIALCMGATSLTYLQCFEAEADDRASRARKQNDMTNPNGIWGTCRGVPDVGFEPDQVTAEALDKTSVNQGDANRIELLTTDDIIKALIGSPVPPPLPGGLIVLEAILPTLCALGADWGCPDAPIGASSVAASSGGDWQ